MYNPNQDIVAGRTASQIESAKRRAVSGSKKRCKKGKSCGATCINGGKVCLVDLPWVSSNGLTKVVKEIQGASKEILARSSGVEHLPQGSLDEVSKAGKEFMDKYRDRLNSSLSTWNRGVALESAITKKIKEDESLTAEQLFRLRKTLQRVVERRKKANFRSLELMDEIRAELLKTKLSEDDIKGILSRIKLSFDDKVDAGPLVKQKGLNNVRGHVEEFARMFNGKGLLGVMDDKGLPAGYLKEILLNPLGRAYQRDDFIMADGSRKTTFHEIAHIVELGRGWLADYAEKWRDGKAFTVRQAERAKGMENIIKDEHGLLLYATLVTGGRNLPVFRLAEMPIHKNSFYDPEEVAVVDKFMNLYMGKIYDKGSEVISVGMEKFASPQDMRHLYMNHPDLFETIVGLAVT